MAPVGDTRLLGALKRGPQSNQEHRGEAAVDLAIGSGTGREERALLPGASMDREHCAGWKKADFIKLSSVYVAPAPPSARAPHLPLGGWTTAAGLWLQSQ